MSIFLITCMTHAFSHTCRRVFFFLYVTKLNLCWKMFFDASNIHGEKISLDSTISTKDEWLKIHRTWKPFVSRYLPNYLRYIDLPKKLLMMDGNVIMIAIIRRMDSKSNLALIFAICRSKVCGSNRSRCRFNAKPQIQDNSPHREVARR